MASGIPKAHSGASSVRPLISISHPLWRLAYPSVLICQWFAPTKLIVSFETTGQGSFTPEDIDRIIIKDKKGDVVSLNLPTKFVMIANHQVRISLLGLLFFLTGISRFTWTGCMNGVCCILLGPKGFTDMCTLH